MSVLVKGMEMPKSCACCSFRVVSECFDDYCAATEGSRYIDAYNGSRQDWCTLVEVPTPHGRLIDADALKRVMIETLEALKKNPKMDRQEMHLIAAFCTLGAMLNDAPTIIPADNDAAMEVTQNG